MLRTIASKAGLLARLATAVEAQLPAATQAAQQVMTAGAASRGYATNSHDVFNIHKDTPINNASIPFDFTEANYERAAKIIARYPPNYKASAVIPILDLAQQQNGGWLSLNAMNKVAEVLEMAPIRVYEVATFYTMFNRSKIGKYHLMVCGTTPCMLNGSRNIEAAIKEELNIEMGDTTADGMFTLSEMECMGCCVNAPMMCIADYSNGVEGFSYNYHEDLSPADVPKIIASLKKGELPKIGSQYRDKAEPAGATIHGTWTPVSAGSQTLTGTPPGPFCRSLDDPPAEPEAKA